MVDYLIVGGGLSGITLANELLERGKSIVMFEDHSQTSSTVAGGVYNPVILKRFTLAWNAGRQLEKAIPFYRKMEDLLGVQLVHELPVYRKFHSIEEQNNWFSAMDKPSVAPFMDNKLVQQVNEHVPANHSLGRVLHTGKVDTGLLIKKFQKYLDQKGALCEEMFDYDALEIRENEVVYKGMKAGRVIFCEGYGMTANPFFNFLPLHGNKGEYLVIKSKELKLNVAVKSSVFILPLGNDHYKVGATYDNKDKSQEPTHQAAMNLQQQLDKMITCEYELVGQEAGIRPATKDRKPLLGQHPQYSRLFCCNGFGSRGVLIAPVMAVELALFMEEGRELDPEVDIKRFLQVYGN